MPTAYVSPKEGDEIVFRLERNPKQGSRFPLKSNWTAEGPTGKMIVPVESYNGVPLEEGQTWLGRVARVTGKHDRLGLIEVLPLRRKMIFTKPKDVWFDEQDLHAMAELIARRYNVMLLGPQGSGKTEAGLALAQMLEMEYHKVSCARIKKASQMEGRVRPGAGNSKIGWEWSDSEPMAVIRYAAAHPRKRILMHNDEWTRMDEDARDGWLDILEGKVRKVRVNGDEIEVSPNLHFFGSGNVGLQYVIKRIDPASNDRWFIFKQKYMPIAEEKARVLRDFPNCPQDQLHKLLEIINQIRNARFQGNTSLSFVPSTRVSLRAALLLDLGFDLEYALDRAVVNPYEGFKENPNCEAGRVHDLILAGLGKKRAAA